MVATTVFGMGLFFAELRAAFGWSAAATAAGFSLQRLQGGVLQPLSGFVVDRVGTRIMSFLGVLLVGIGFVLFSQVTSSGSTTPRSSSSPAASASAWEPP